MASGVAGEGGAGAMAPEMEKKLPQNDRHKGRRMVSKFPTHFISVSLATKIRRAEKFVTIKKFFAYRRRWRSTYYFLANNCITETEDRSAEDSFK